MIKKILFLYLLSSTLFISAQDLTDELKIEYSSYLYFRVNKKMYIDNFNLSCFSAAHHNYNFMQNETNFNYKITKKFILLLGDAIYLNKWTPSYQYAYNTDINPLGTILFHRPTLGFRFKFEPFKYGEFEETMTYQFFTPSLEKYQSRITFGSKFSYDNPNSFLGFEPFTQIIYYYYLNGEPVPYYNENGYYDGYYSPNGLHRYRFRLGFKIKPSAVWDKFDFMLYFAAQKEFNALWLGGHPLNYARANQPIDTKQKTYLPYNNYNIVGIQVNYVFDKSANKKKKKRRKK